MKVVKTILIVLAIIIAIPLILALFTAKEYTVAREVTINRSGTDVFGYVKHLKNQDHYSKWVMADPHMKKNYKGVDGTEGLVYSWDGNDDAGEGAQEITNIVEGQVVNTEIRFVRPLEGIAKTEFRTQQLDAGQTKVTWQFHSAMPYPANAVLLFADMDDIMGKDMETSLGNLKNVLEK